MGWDAPVTASDGQTYSIYRQDKANSCGCGSVVTIARLTTGKILEESTVRRAVGDFEGHGWNTEGMRNFGAGGWGAAADAVVEALRKYADLSGHLVKGADNAKTWISRCTRANPGIVMINWVDAGYHYTGHAHWSVCVGVHAGRAIFLDPGYGLVEMAESDLPWYGSDANGWGTIDGLISVVHFEGTSSASAAAAAAPAVAAAAAAAPAFKLPKGAIPLPGMTKK